MALVIVDDSRENRFLLESLLNGAGYRETTSLGSAEEVLNLLDTPEGEAIELILMDVRMPGIDGLEACRRIKAHPACGDIPVIVVTGVNDYQILDEAFRSGAADFITKPVNRTELLARIRSVLTMRQEIRRRVERERELEEVTASLREANRYLERLSMLDPLTGIANRRYFEQMYTQEWRRAVRYASSISLIFLDIDHFKAYNDTYGHPEGDRVLRAVAGILKRGGRRGSDFAARFGGEEFVVLLPDVAEEGAAQVAQQLLEGIRGLNIPHQASAVEKRITVSLGVVSCNPVPGIDEQRLVAVADEALYDAKRGGRNRMVQHPFTDGIAAGRKKTLHLIS